MVYTKKHPALLVMGVLLLLLGGLTNAGVLDGVIGYLKIGGKTGEITSLSYIFGTMSVLVGIWHMWGKHVEGNLDYYLSTIAGGMFILLIAMLVTVGERNGGTGNSF